MLTMSDNLKLACPCCSTRLVVDRETGEILSETRPKRDAEKTFDERFQAVKDGSAEREEAFDRAFDRTQKLDDLLDKKFEEARKKAKDDKSRPHNPLDFD